MSIRESLQQKTLEERIALKATAIEQAFVVDERVATVQERGSHSIEITGMNKIEGGVEVFARVWTGKQQVGFGEDGTVDIERFRIFNPPILVEDPNGDIVKVTEAEPGFRNPTRVETRFREDPTEAILQVIEHAISVMKNIHGPEKIIPGKVGNTTSTFYPSMDGYARYNSASALTFAGILDAAGNQNNTAATTASVHISGGSGTGASTNYDVLQRYLAVFDSSSIPDADTISSATLSLYVTSKADEFSANKPTFTIMGATLASDATIASSDYEGTFDNNQTSFATAKTYADITTTAYNDWALNASGIAAISKTGNSRFSARFAQDITGGTPAPQQATGAREYQMVFSTVDETGTTQDPKLVVEHAASASEVSVFETFSLTESHSETLIANSSVFDTFSLTENTASMRAAFASLVETFALTENSSTTVAHNSSVNDNLVLTESVGNLRQINLGTPFETFQLSDATTVSLGDLLASVLDEFTLTESQQFLLSTFLTVAEELNLTENLGVTVAFVANAVDIFVLTDNVSREKQAATSVQLPGGRYQGSLKRIELKYGGRM